MNIMLLGSNGQLGKELERKLSMVGNLYSFSKSYIDITNYDVIKNKIKLVKPDVIINAAAFTAVDRAETEISKAYAINKDAVINLSKIAKREDAWLIHYSTDYVFDGLKSSAYLETDIPNPINIYGASKLAGEKGVIDINCKHIIFRTTWVIGKDGDNFAKIILKLASKEKKIKVVNDQIGVPTSTSLITKVTLEFISSIKKNMQWSSGIYHLTPNGVSNWHEIAINLIRLAKENSTKLSISEVEKIKTLNYPTIAKRPLNSLLNTQKLKNKISFKLPDWKEDFQNVAIKIVEEFNTA